MHRRAARSALTELMRQSSITKDYCKALSDYVYARNSISASVYTVITRAMTDLEDEDLLNLPIDDDGFKYAYNSVYVPVAYDEKGESFSIGVVLRDLVQAIVRRRRELANAELDVTQVETNEDGGLDITSVGNIQDYVLDMEAYLTHENWGGGTIRVPIADIIEALVSQVAKANAHAVVLSALSKTELPSLADVASSIQNVCGDAATYITDTTEMLTAVATDKFSAFSDKVTTIMQSVLGNSESMTCSEETPGFTRIEVDSGAYSGAAAMDMWQTAFNSSAVGKAFSIIGTAVKAVVGAAIGIIKMGLGLVKKLFIKWIKPAFVSKDFVKAEGTTDELFVDVPSWQSVSKFDEGQMVNDAYRLLTQSDTADVSFSARGLFTAQVRAAMQPGSDVDMYELASKDAHELIEAPFFRMASGGVCATGDLYVTIKEDEKGACNFWRHALDDGRYSKSKIVLKADSAHRAVAGNMWSSNFYRLDDKQYYSVYAHYYQYGGHHEGYSYVVPYGSSIEVLSGVTRVIRSGSHFAKFRVKTCTHGCFVNNISYIKDNRTTSSGGSVISRVSFELPLNGSRPQLDSTTILLGAEPKGSNGWSNGDPHFTDPMATKTETDYLDIEIPIPSWLDDAELGRLRLSPINANKVSQREMTIPGIKVIRGSNYSRSDLCVAERDITATWRVPAGGGFRVYLDNKLIGTIDDDDSSGTLTYPSEYEEALRRGEVDLVEDSDNLESQYLRRIVFNVFQSKARANGVQFTLVIDEFGASMSNVIQIGTSPLSTVTINGDNVTISTSLPGLRQYLDKGESSYVKQQLRQAIADFFTPGAITKIRTRFMSVQAAQAPDGSLEIFEQAFLNPIDWVKLFKSDGACPWKLKYDSASGVYLMHLSEDIDDLRAGDYTIADFVSDVFAAEPSSCQFSDEEGDVEAFRRLQAARKGYRFAYMLAYYAVYGPLSSSDIPDLGLFNNIVFGDEAVPAEKVSNADLLSSLTIEDLPFGNSFTYYYLQTAIWMKKEAMSWYYAAMDDYPEFMPYTVGQPLGSAAWHIKTDKENEEFVSNFVTALVIAAVVLALVAIGITIALKIRKAVKMAIIKNQQKKELNSESLWNNAAQNRALNESVVNDNRTLSDINSRLKGLDKDSPEYASLLSQRSEVTARLASAKKQAGELAKERLSLARQSYKTAKKERKLQKLAALVGCKESIASAVSSAGSDPVGDILTSALAKDDMVDDKQVEDLSNAILQASSAAASAAEGNQGLLIESSSNLDSIEEAMRGSSIETLAQISALAMSLIALRKAARQTSPVKGSGVLPSKSAD